MAKFKNSLGVLETNNKELIKIYRESGLEEIPEPLEVEEIHDTVKEKTKSKKSTESE